MVGDLAPPDTELEAAVQETLRAFLVAEGFSDPVPARTGGLVFRNGEFMLRLLRMQSATHPFDVQVSLGRRRTADIVDWVRVGKLSAESSMAHACWVWELPDIVTLAAAIERLRVEVLEPHVAPFWRDPTRLAPVLAAQEQEREQRFRAGLEQQNLRAARESFQQGRFQEADRYYDRVEQLSAADQQRRDIAREAIEQDTTDTSDE